MQEPPVEAAHFHGEGERSEGVVEPVVEPTHDRVPRRGLANLELGVDVAAQERFAQRAVGGGARVRRALVPPGVKQQLPEAVKAQRQRGAHVPRRRSAIALRLRLRQRAARRGTTVTGATKTRPAGSSCAVRPAGCTRRKVSVQVDTVCVPAHPRRKARVAGGSMFAAKASGSAIGSTTSRRGPPRQSPRIRQSRYYLEQRQRSDDLVSMDERGQQNCRRTRLHDRPRSNRQSGRPAPEPPRRPRSRRARPRVRARGPPAGPAPGKSPPSQCPFAVPCRSIRDPADRRDGKRRRHRATINGVDYYYEVHGDGEPLLLLHGGLLSIASFGPAMPTFTKGRKVIAVDLQGHGRSTLGGPAAAPRNDGRRHPTCCCSSSGTARSMSSGTRSAGGVALRLAAQHPRRVRRLALVCTVFADDGWYADIRDQQKRIGAAIAPMMMGNASLRNLRGGCPEAPGLPAAAGRDG